MTSLLRRLSLSLESRSPGNGSSLASHPSFNDFSFHTAAEVENSEGERRDRRALAGQNRAPSQGMGPHRHPADPIAPARPPQTPTLLCPAASPGR